MESQDFAFDQAHVPGACTEVPALERGLARRRRISAASGKELMFTLTAARRARGALEVFHVLVVTFAIVPWCVAALPASLLLVPVNVKIVRGIAGRIGRRWP